MTSGKYNLSFEIKKDPKSMTSEELEDLLKFSKFETFSKKNNLILSSKGSQRYSPPRTVLNDLQQSYSISDVKKSRDFNIEDQIFLKNKAVVNDYSQQTKMVEDSNKDLNKANQRFFYDKYKEIQKENEELKEALRKAKEYYETEKQDMKNFFLQELKSKNQLENEYNSVPNNGEKNSNVLLKNEIIFLKNSLDLVEKEKNKHLEQNIIEKEALIKEINSLKRDLENIKKIMKEISSKNHALTQNELIHEKTISDLRQQLFELKKTLSKTTTDYKNIMDDMKISFTKEKNDLLHKKNTLEEIVRENENDQKKIVSSYEKQIRELMKELAKLDKNKSKGFKIKSLLNNLDMKNPIITKNTRSPSVNSKYNLTKSSSTSELRAKKQKSNNVFNNNLNKTKTANNNTDLSYISQSKKHSIASDVSPDKVNIVNHKDENSKLNLTRNNSLKKDKSVKLNTNEEDIYQDRLSGINDQIFFQERENVELKRIISNLENEVMQKLNEDEKKKISEKIEENIEKLKKNNVKLYELKTQQKNVLMLSLNF